MNPNTSQKSVLLIGRSQLVIDAAAARLAELGYTAQGTNDFSEIIERFDMRQVDLVVFGGAVPPELKAELRDEMSAINPAIIFVQGLAGIPGLIVTQVQGAFASEDHHHGSAPTYSHDGRSIQLALTEPAKVKVTLWSQAFGLQAQRSDSVVLLDEHLGHGAHTLRIPTDLTADSTVASVEINAAVYAFAI
jgi:hypothetical protein